MQLPLSPQDIGSPQWHDKKKLPDALTSHIQILHLHDQEENQSMSKMIMFALAIPVML